MYPAKRIAVIGAGGKTTALARLAARCRDAHVLLTTTTHILPFAPPVCDRLCVTPDAGALRAALQAPGVTCAGMAAGDGKLTALPAPLWELACQQADFIFYEADGAKRLPLKLHAAHEPVIQPGCRRGASRSARPCTAMPCGRNGPQNPAGRSMRRSSWPACRTQLPPAACRRHALLCCSTRQMRWNRPRPRTWRGDWNTRDCSAWPVACAHSPSRT